MPEHPLYRSVEATESALRLLPSIALSSAQSGLILLGRVYTEAILVVGSEGITLKPWGMVQAKNQFPPRRYSAC